ncbi:MAG: radical SAM protein, partial [Clostridia bacterium]|nr:radical SAM protein [Clostridia bacterium]
KQLPKLCPQFHMSLQSGCDETLKRMRRRYTTDDFRHAVSLLRQEIPDTAITTDLMVGFAGETDEEFQASYNFCKEIGFSQMHIFPYSIRKGTAAENFPNQVPESLKTSRTHAMLKLAEEMKETFYRRYLGQTIPVLLEQKEGNLWHGTTANYMDILVDAPDGISGQTVLAEFLDYENEKIIANIK